MRLTSAQLRDNEARQTSLAQSAFVGHRLWAAGTPSQGARPRRFNWAPLNSLARDAAESAAEAVHLEVITLISQQWLYGQGWETPQWAPSLIQILEDEQAVCREYGRERHKLIPTEGTDPLFDYMLSQKHTFWTGMRIEHIDQELVTVRQLEEFGSLLRNGNLNLTLFEECEDPIALRCLAIFYRNRLLEKAQS